MADSPKSKKRLVKNPETFREKALKASANNDKPTRTRRLKQAGSKASKPVFGPIGRLFAKVFNRRPFRLIGRVLVPRYLRSSFSELRLVEWPKTRQARDLTFAVLAFAVVFGGTVAVVDYGLDKVFKGILLK